MSKETARRYNRGKLRYELFPNFAMQELARVYTLGAHKYSIYKDKSGKEILGKDIPFEEASKYELIDDASGNWRKGQDWMESIGSIERHIEAYKKGEDMDELGSYHLSNAAWGLLTLTEYYKIYPQGDNRPHKYLNMPRIGLDVDDIIADFIGGFGKKYGLDTPHNWLWSYENKARFEKMASNPSEFEEFYLNLLPKIDPATIPFEPVCYITSRNIPQSITETWIEKNGFPCAPVYTVGHDMSKVEAAIDAKVDIFVDDRFENFVELNNAGICTYLYDAPHNQRYNVGHKRIYKLSDIIDKI